MELAEIDNALIDEIVRRITRVSQPDRVILFGSAARGEMSRDSDIDLLILEKEIRDERQEWMQIREALRGLGCGIDLFLMTTDWFEASKGVIGGLAYPANKHGRVIYAAA